MRRLTPNLVILALAFVLVPGSRAIFSQKGQDPPQNHDPLDWTEGYSLIITGNSTYQQANDAVDFIHAQGGQVALVVSPRVMLGWLPTDAESSIVGQRGVLSLHRQPVTPQNLVPKNDDETDSIQFFNRVASGEWRKKKNPLANHGLQPNYPSDALVRPRGSAGTVTVAGSTDVSLSPGNSDVMAGRIVFSAIFVESNGATDPNTYTWTCTHMETMVGEIEASLSFWSSRARTYGVPLTWIIKFERPAAVGCAGTPNVLTSYEPILHSGASGGDGLWINQIMCNYGHCGGNKFDKTDSFNSARRTTFLANWATTAFIGYNPSPAATTFTDGSFAYAYRDGPYSQLLFRNDGWSVSLFDLANAHETGHLFGTDDEYATSGCGNCFSGDGFSQNVVNGNCVNCNPGSVPCIMRNNELALCGYTPGQLGWGLDINSVRTTRTTNFVAKTNWTPGQAIRYVIHVDLPGRPGEAVDVTSRWFRQFPGGITESEVFVQPGLITTGTDWFLNIDRTVPAGSSFGEASLQVFLEINYPDLPDNYGKGMRASARRAFYILPASANEVSLSPGQTTNDPPRATPTEMQP